MHIRFSSLLASSANHIQVAESVFAHGEASAAEASAYCARIRARGGGCGGGERVLCAYSRSSCASAESAGSTRREAGCRTRQETGACVMCYHSNITSSGRPLPAFPVILFASEASHRAFSRLPARRARSSVRLPPRTSRYMSACPTHVRAGPRASNPHIILASVTHTL